MTDNQTEAIERARRVRDLVAERMLQRPEVSLVDIGYDPEGASTPQRPVVRVHVRRRDIELDLPDEIDGVPVRVMTGNYRLE